MESDDATYPDAFQNDTDVEKETVSDEKRLDQSLEGNVVCTMFVLITGVVMDALCALPGVVLEDVPASLRTTSLVLAVLLGSPPVSKSKLYVLEQRCVLAVLLGCVSFVGMNKAEVNARIADGLFSLVGTLSAVVACSTNGAMRQKDTEDERKETREHLAALTGAIFLYLGLRSIKNAFSMPIDVTSFSVSHAEFNVRGYGISNDVAVVGLSFSGCIIASFGMIVLLNHDMLLRVGSNGLSRVSAVLAPCAFVGAFATQISTYSLLEHLPALFSSAACNGDPDYCSAAYRARRQFVASNSSSVAWIGTIGITTFAFTNSKRFTSRKQHFLFVSDVYDPAQLSSILSTFVCLLTVFWFADQQVSMHFAELELVLLLVSIPAAVLCLPVTAGALHVAAQGMYIFTRLSSDDGFTWMYFTHHSIVATVVLTAVVTGLSGISYFLYTTAGDRLYSEPVEAANGFLTTSLLSVQLFLTISTMAMSSGYTGVHYEDGKGSWRTTGYEFAVQHSVSFFFCAALYAGRYEHSSLSVNLRRAAWFVGPVLLGVSWMLCVVLASSDGLPYTQWVDVASFLVGMSAACISWVGVGVFLHF